MVKYNFIKYIVLITIAIIILISFIREMNSYEFKYYQCDNEIIITGILYQGRTFFVQGYYNEENIPSNYIEPIYSGISGSYRCCFLKRQDTCFIYYSNGTWNNNNESNKFLLIEESYDYVDSLYKVYQDKMICIYGGETGAIIIDKSDNE